MFISKLMLRVMVMPMLHVRSVQGNSNWEPKTIDISNWTRHVKCAIKGKPAGNHSIREYTSPSSPVPSLSEEETKDTPEANSATENGNPAVPKTAVGSTSSQSMEFEEGCVLEQNLSSLPESIRCEDNCPRKRSSLFT